MKILLFGGSGLVGSRFIDLFTDTHEIIAPGSEEIDITNSDQLSEYIKKSDAEAIINLAAFTIVDKAEEEKDNTEGIVYKLNVTAAKDIATVALQTDKYLLHISTDYVFDGTKEDAPYTEEDIPSPLNWYGKTKLLGEEAIQQVGGRFAIARIEMPYSAHYEKKSDFARFFLEKFKSGEDFSAVEDQKITPIFVDDCVKALEKLIESMPNGIYHVASTDTTSPAEFAATLGCKADEMDILENAVDLTQINNVKFADFNAGRIASRPKNSWLNVTKFQLEFGDGILKTNDEGVTQFLSSQLH